MKHVLIYLVNGDCHSIHHCTEAYRSTSDPKYVRLETDERTYVYNMSAIEHIELVEEVEHERLCRNDS